MKSKTKKKQHNVDDSDDEFDDNLADYLRLEEKLTRLCSLCFESRAVEKMTERMNLKHTGTMMHNSAI